MALMFMRLAATAPASVAWPDPQTSRLAKASGSPHAHIIFLMLFLPEICDLLEQRRGAHHLYGVAPLKHHPLQPKLTRRATTVTHRDFGKLVESHGRANHRR
jgi:hypothetical protein